MDSTVKTRPSHYDVLGLTPGASDEEIAQAFARELRQPRAFGGLAEVGVAYGVLRDPAKRQAYDASIGLKPEPEPGPEPEREPEPEQRPWLIATARPSWAQLIAPVPTGPSERPSVDTALLHMPRAEMPAPRQAPAEPRPGSFIAASLRQPAGPDEPGENLAGKSGGPEAVYQPQAEAGPSVEQLLSQLDAVRQPDAQSVRDVEDRPVGWSRTGATIGALVLGTVLLGAWAGLEARDGEEPQSAGAAASVKLPPPKPLAGAAVASATAQPGMAESGVLQPTQIAAGTHRIARAVSPRRPSAPKDRLAEISQSLEGGDVGSATAESGAGQTSAETQPVAAVAASMPLPGALIARTIGRIGYPCGQVASTSAAEGDAPGVFKVTCTSGHSYRAAPVGGRYRFKRWGGR